MGGLRRTVHRLYTFLRPEAAEQELRRETEAHLRLLEEDFLSRGLPADEARRAARRAFGGLEQSREMARDARSFVWLEDLRRDVRHAGRGLARTPGFTAIAVLTIGLGIGGTTASFSVVNGVLLDPLPFPEADRLVAVRHSMPGVGNPDAPLSRAMYLTFREHARTLDDIGLWYRTAITVTGSGDPERVDVVLVTDGLFPLLGIEPVAGRGYTHDDFEPGTESRILLSQGYWLRRFGGDSDAIGRRLTLNGQPRTVIGVMPEAVDDLFGAPAPALFVQLQVAEQQRVGNWSYPGLARLRGGVTAEAAGNDLTGLTQLATELYPGIPFAELEARGFTTFVRPLKQELVGATGPAIWIVFGMLALLLLVACANVAGLFLARAEAGTRDAALRTAMGASRGRLARQMLTESSVIGVLGGGLGMLLAWMGVSLFLGLAADDLPRGEAVAIDATVLLFTVVVSLGAGVVFGLFPLLSGGRGDLVTALRSAAGTSAPGDRRRRGLPIRTALAATQVALALVLLIGAGLMAGSWRALTAVPPGFSAPENVLTFRLSVPPASQPTGGGAALRHEEIIRRLAALPGVTSVAAATSIAMDRWDSWNDINVEDFPDLDTDTQPLRRFNWITPDYFATIRNRIVAGRELTWADIDERRPLAVITENMARALWQEPDRALGRRLRSDGEPQWLEVIGVVGDVHTAGVSREAPEVLYLPYLMPEFWGSEDFTWRELRYGVRTSRADVTSLLPEIRQAIRAIDPDLPIYQEATLQDILTRSLRRESFTAVALSVAAGIALLLGIVGVYGTVSYVMARRTAEVGIRMALGARPGQILWMVLRQGGTVGAVGAAIGLVVALGLARFLESLLFGISSTDPLTYGALALLLLTVVMLASGVPARRAARLDPTTALKRE